MKKEGYYSSGEFAKKAHVTLRTIRYYDKQNILVPSARTESGARLYTDEDLAKLQQILLLKYLGFSLEDIREIYSHEQAINQCGSFLHSISWSPCVCRKNCYRSASKKCRP